MKVTVREISIASTPESTFYLKLEWTTYLGAGFVVLLCDGVSAWSGEVSEEDVSREAQEMEMTREKYVNELQQILTGEGQPDQRYSFHLTPSHPGSSMLQLSYEKVQSNMSFRFGMVELLPVPVPTNVIKELISYGLDRSARLQIKISDVRKENQRLRNEQENITTELKRYIEEKEILERELYNRFVLILNGKKDKIRTLQETIKQLQNDIKDKTYRYKKGKVCDGVNEHAAEKSDESNYGSTTDEEEDGDPKTGDPKTQKASSQELTSNFVDESLNDIADVAPSRRRRQRGIPPMEPKRPAPQKPSRNDLLEDAESEVTKVPFQQPVKASPDPDDLFDDI